MRNVIRDFGIWIRIKIMDSNTSHRSKEIGIKSRIFHLHLN